MCASLKFLAIHICITLVSIVSANRESIGTLLGNKPSPSERYVSPFGWDDALASLSTCKPFFTCKAPDPLPKCCEGLSRSKVALWGVLAEYKEHVLKLWAAGGDFNAVGCKSERRHIAELEKKTVDFVSRRADRLMVAEVEIDLDKGRCFIHSCFC
ncbi:hypothetical protein V6N13_014207 [Hibiscus sabdariffa]|uniref:Uncharacterized protein n=1 Tax=Hibiscus sabdariffa TaxID=183260 RepID=A0ABR2RUW5_9ROSI